MGRAVSRFGAPAGSHPARYSHRSRVASAALHYMLLKERVPMYVTEINHLSFNKWWGKEGFVPFRCGRPLSCGVDGEPLQLRLQGLTCPLFPRESAVLRCTALCAFGGENAHACDEIQPPLF
ncbi:hypothetical protein [Rossellomorea marisflavi]|uniref:hypothetical protein n=2 Tax=Rossellomorea marisflavi TaxID=189381 RepID=UPI00165316B0|nr:hypothetical protein [Rossellomorea marisflavi]